jgi:hypothetical protein
MNNWLNVGVKGGAIWPQEEIKVSFGGHELVLKPATKETEQSVHVNLKGISNIDALTLINRFLSILSWCDDQGIENMYGWSGSAAPAPVPRESRAVGSSIAFPFGRQPETDKRVKLALALYREGRTVNSNAFSFLSYFKILNIFWKDKYINNKNELIEGIRESLPTVDKEAKKRIEKLKKEDEKDIAKYLYESGRCAIAHAYAEPIVDPDDVSELHRLSEDVWIVKSIAEILIQERLEISRSIIS